MEQDRARDGIIPNQNYRDKSDECDGQVSGSMPGIQTLDHKGDHSMQDADIVGKGRGYPFVTRVWEQKSQNTPGEASE